MERGAGGYSPQLAELDRTEVTEHAQQAWRTPTAELGARGGGLHGGPQARFASARKVGLWSAPSRRTIHWNVEKTLTERTVQGDHGNCYGLKRAHPPTQMHMLEL